ncbi:DUF499 domain-containing protein [Roseibaca sp. V10]|uniref:DUF499 domain-containing protein n=1 Tax=Roseinatronobacter domitianus TaxID=2940293 RepID=A0ABT0M4B1_9RHOB|nr:DUF499 domain-containing protein [Roseibaca domitiana]MCL1629488.1 DUF499 domain-containing protein [Roseibaca domitiana]
MVENLKNSACASVALLNEGLGSLDIRIPPKLSEQRFWSPQAFFRETYFTAGLRDLMIRVAGGLSGNFLPSIYELDARSGGGKTHALLALYHMVGAGASLNVPELRGLFSEASTALPEKINRVVITGGVSHPRVVGDALDDFEIKTLWGEIAWQIGGREAYEIVADHDRTGTPPPSNLLMNVLSDHSPCLILVDGWLSYLNHVGQASERPDDEALLAHLGFIFSFSEAVRRVPGAVLVASEPEGVVFSDRRAREIRTELHKIFKFVERWQPATPAEKLEIARKRLCGDVANNSDLVSLKPAEAEE